MAPTKQTLTLISISTLLFSTLYARETLPQPAAPSPTPSTDGGPKAAIKQLEAIEEKIKFQQKSIAPSEDSPNVPALVRRCTHECVEGFEIAVGHVRVAIELINKGDLEKAELEISGVYPEVNKCYNCYKMMKEGPFTTLRDGTKGLEEWVAVALADCYKNLER